MFFVVSGFLITLLLIKEATTTGRVRIGRFYARRARRILPPLVITLSATLFMLWKLGTLVELKAAAATAQASLLQVANWHQITTNSGYWESTGQIIPLGQMWSLSITEQFYVVWPLIMAMLWFVSRRRPGALALWIFAVLAGAAVVAPVLFNGANTDRLYLGTDVRAVSFVAGAAIASFVAWVLVTAPTWAGPMPSLASRAIITSISGISLAAVVTASVATSSYHEAWLYQGGFTAVSVAIGVFIATLCFPANALARFFTWKPLRLVGVLAYGMFLLHLPVFWFLQHITNSTMHPLVLFGLGGFFTWLIATVLHYVVTEPLRTRSWTPAGATASIVVTFALVAGAAWYLPINRVNNPHQQAREQSGPDDVFAIDATVKLPKGHAGGPLKVAVIGDSVGQNMYEALAEYRTGDVEAYDVTLGGCGIFDADSARSGEGYIMDTKNQCWPWQDKLRAANKDHQPDVYILHNLWDANDQLINGKWVGPTTPEWQERYRSQLELLVAIGDSSENPPLILLSNDRSRDPAGPLSPKRLESVDSVAASVADAHANVELLDLVGAVCPGGTCQTETPEGKPLYRDGSHFAPSGLAYLAPWLENQMAKNLSNSP